MSKISILQPSYLPWLGYFEQMHVCDIFVYLDDVQYTKNDWRNRNRIKTKEGMQWLTVPVSFTLGQKINEVLINNSHQWYRKHFQALKTWYGKSAYFKVYSEELKAILYKERTRLTELDVELTQWITGKMGLQTKTVLSSEISAGSGDRQFRLIEICKALGGNYLYEGKSGQNYIDRELFRSNGITVEFQDYQHPGYNQLWMKEQGFISFLSAIDLLLNHGPDSLSVLTGRRVIPGPDRVRVRKADELQDERIH